MGSLMFILPPLETGAPYKPPGAGDFFFSGGFIPGVDWFNKPLVQAIIAAIVVIVLWWLVARRLKVVPTKSQFLAETVYDVVRNGIARDALGADFR
ncbi:MAG: F0F1 ATP synthase subunit A, partial [Propionibacteriaceae bacterium]|nr:F0F1 ATP synthase subunit A [Propionibacteriaceae bacterium]